jgi:uncharacterized protein YegP (UPF0339 family)
MGAARFEIGFGPNNKYQWKLFGPDNKEVIVSQPFGNRDDAFGAIRAVKENAPFNERYKKLGEKEALSFRLMSASHVDLATSGAFKTVEERDAAISIVRRCPEAAVMDKTS